MRERNIHFIALGMRPEEGGKPFSLIHLLAILSAHRAYLDHRIFVHYDRLPTGPFWEIAEKYVTLSQVEAPKEVFGRPIYHYAHAADVLRLQILIKDGGIYFDIDTIICRPINELPEDRTIMGAESPDDRQIHGLCNAFIAAPSQAPFLRRWLSEYHNFDPTQWNQHSVKLPLALSIQMPDDVLVMPRRNFFYPSWVPEGVRDLWEGVVDTTPSYSIHLWESQSASYVASITVEDVLSKDTTYNLAARPTVEAFHDELAKFGRRPSVTLSGANWFEATKAFKAIYARGDWGRGSGPGSYSENTIEYVAFLSRFMERNKIRTAVDLGCGDWEFSRYVDFSGIQYKGFDIVEEIIEENNKKYVKENINFEIFKSCEFLPAADLLICKDVLQHWPNKRIIQEMEILIKKFRYLLITNDEEPLDRQNDDISYGGWRAIDLRRSPFGYRAATIFSWYVGHGGSTTRKATQLIMGSGT